MVKNFSGKVIGFDLDGTLYRTNEKMDNQIKEYIFMRASEMLNREYLTVRKSFDENYSKNRSGSKSLQIIGIETNNAKNLMQSALENINIDFIEKDKRLIKLIKDIHEKYKLFMITSNKKSIAIKKLDALDVDYRLFDPLISYENNLFREDMSAFRYIAKEFRVNYNDILFVGDREQTDIIPAKKIGIKTAIVNSESKLADFRLKEIYDIKFILE